MLPRCLCFSEQNRVQAPVGKGRAEVVGGRNAIKAVGLQFLQGCEESVGPRVAGDAEIVEERSLLAHLRIGRLDGLDFGGGVLPACADFGGLGRDLDPTLIIPRHSEGKLALAFFAVALLVGVGSRFVVAGYRLIRAVRNARFEHVAVEDADEGVAVFDVVVEEGEGEAGGVGFDPEGDFAEVYGEGVFVDGVDALLDDVAAGVAAFLVVGFGGGGADFGELVADASGGGEEEVPGACGGVADAEVEEGSFFCGGGRGGGEAFLHDGDECGVDEFADEFGRGVVGAGLLAFGAGGEVEGAMVGGDAGRVVEQGFVDGAEFFDVEVCVVDAAEALVFGAVVGEVADGLEEFVVGAFGGFEVSAGGFAEELAVERGEADDACGVFVAADAEGLAEADPEVGVVVGLVGVAVGAAAEAGDAVVLGEDGVFGGVRVAGEEFAFFGDHEEEEAVDEVEQLAVEGGGVEFAVLEGLAELAVVFALEERAAECFECLLDAVAEFVADASAFFDALLVEAFEGALVCGFFGPGEAGAVEEAVEEDEVGVGVVVDDGFEVELEPSGA